jgi:polyhydroxyalkanoate synthesis repressor PhaR
MSEDRKDQGRAAEQSGVPRLIKRYANRKLYDTTSSRYVTLEEIGEMVKGGADVKIVDNRNQEDLTAVTLAQIIFEAEKRRSRMPLLLLTDIIRHGGETLSDFIEKEVTPRVASLKEGAGAGLKKLARDNSRELLGATSGVLSDWQRRVDDQIHKALAQVSPVLLKGEVHGLEARLDELERRLQGLEHLDPEGKDSTG